MWNAFVMWSGSFPKAACWSSRGGKSCWSLPWVTAVAAREGAFRITVRDVQAAKRTLLALAVNSGIVLNRYEVVRPSLEDVFLQLVGAERAA